MVQSEQHPIWTLAKMCGQSRLRIPLENLQSERSPSLHLNGPQFHNESIQINREYIFNLQLIISDLVAGLCFSNGKNAIKKKSFKKPSVVRTLRCCA